MLNSPGFGGPSGMAASFGPRVERQDQAALQLEQRGCPGRRDLIAGPLRPDHPFRFESETLAVERQTPLEVRHGERDHIDSGIHRSAVYQAGPLTRPGAFIRRSRRSCSHANGLRRAATREIICREGCDPIARTTMQTSSDVEATPDANAAGATAHDDALGTRFAEALCRKDFDGLLALMDASIDFRGLTPGRTWEATGPDAVVDGILRQWFEETDALDEIARIETDAVADRRRVAYRFKGHNADGPSSSSSRRTTPRRAAGSTGCACCAPAFDRTSAWAATRSRRLNAAIPAIAASAASPVSTPIAVQLRPVAGTGPRWENSAVSSSRRLPVMLDPITSTRNDQRIRA